MDDYVGCIMTFIAIVVCIWLVGAVIALLIFTLPAWGSGAISGTAAYGVARLKLASDLRNPAKFSQLVNLSFDGLELHSKIKRDAVESYVTPYNIASIIVCILVTIIVYIAVVSEPSMLGSEEKWIQILGILITAALAGGFVFFLWTKLELTSVVETQVKRSLEKANSSFQATGELQDVIRDNALLAQKLQLDFPQDYVGAVRSYIDAHKTKVLTDPSSLQSVISVEIEKAKWDQSNLQKAIERFDEVIQLHQKVSRTVFATGSPSMVKALDLIHEQIHQAKEVCLTQREWGTFDEAMTMYEQDFKELEKQALNITVEGKPDFDANDPYRVLGVSPEMDSSEIKKVYRELCQIYHPDKGKVRDAAKFKEVKNAYDEIVKQRK